MQEKLDFSLPEKKQSSVAANWIVIVLLLILTALTGANLALRPTGTEGVAQTADASLSDEQVKQYVHQNANAKADTKCFPARLFG